MELKEYNFNVPYINLDKVPVLNQDQSVQTIGLHLANVLASIQQGNPIILMQWAQTVYNNEVLKINDDDKFTLIAIVTQCPLPAILRVQLLNVLQG